MKKAELFYFLKLAIRPKLLGILAMLLLASVVFASRYQGASCADEQQYIKVGSTYQAVTYGSYYCEYTPSQVCTYYRSNAVPAVYTICEYGVYTPSGLK